MKKIVFILFFIFGYTHAQIPDYARLTKKQKIRYLNGYGFIITTTNDTIYGVVRGNQAKGAATLNKKKQIKVNYPRDLEKYSYLTEIPLSQIKYYYNVGYRTHKYVRKVGSEYFIFDKIVEGKISIFERNEIKYKLFVSINIDVGTGGVGLGAGSRSKRTSQIYFEDQNDGKLILIMGRDRYDVFEISKKEIKENFINFFQNKVENKELEKIKPRKSKLIEFVKKYNTEYN